MSLAELCVFIFLFVILLFLIYIFLKQKEISGEIIYIKENLLQKKEIFTLESFQAQIDQIVSIFQNLEKRIESIVNTTKSNWENFPKILEELLKKEKDWEFFLNMLQKALNDNKEILLTQFFSQKEEENAQKEQAFYKKFLQGQRQSLTQILENWEKKQEEKEKNFALVCKSLEQFLSFLKFLKKKQEENQESISRLENLFLQFQASLSPVIKEFLSWQKEPLARRNDLEKKRVTVLMDFEEYRKFQKQNDSSDTAPISKEISKAQDKEEKQEEKQEDKLKLFLTKIHKQKMHFVGASLQDTVLHLIHEILLEKKSILRSDFLSEITARVEPYISEKKISKTKINGILNIIQAGRCFDITKNEEDEKSLFSLAEKYRDYKDLRKLHDFVLIKLAKDFNISFSAKEWSVFLYGNAQKTKEIEEISRLL